MPKDEIWPDFCCKGHDFLVYECDSSGWGYGICLNSECPRGDEVQSFQLDSGEEDEVVELDEELAALFQ